MADPAASTPRLQALPVEVTRAGGLSDAEVAERRSRGLGNAGGERTSRSVGEILRANIMTRFNLILGVLLAVIWSTCAPATSCRPTAWCAPARACRPMSRC